MDSVLIDAWMAGTDAFPAIDEASMSQARLLVRERGAELGLDHIVVERLALAASELVANQLVHGRGGRFAIRAIARGEVPGIEIVAADRGPGISDPARALAGPGPSKTSLGAGLASTRRAVQEMDVDVRFGEGTCVRARAFAEPLARRREVGIAGRICEGEAVSGDHAAFVRIGDALVAAVIDGIGHGPLARDASERAALALLAGPHREPAAIIDACDTAVGGTRGVVMTVARLDESAATIELAGVGNVTARIERYRSSRTFAGSSAVLGARGPRRKPAEERAAIAPDEALIMFTDGLRSSATLADAPEVLRDHPVVAAAWLLAEFGRTNDDALVLVAR